MHNNDNKKHSLHKENTSVKIYLPNSRGPSSSDAAAAGFSFLAAAVSPAVVFLWGGLVAASVAPALGKRLSAVVEEDSTAADPERSSSSSSRKEKKRDTPAMFTLPLWHQTVTQPP